jgi:hypothetical protein
MSTLVISSAIFPTRYSKYHCIMDYFMGGKEGWAAADTRKGVRGKSGHHRTGYPVEYGGLVPLGGTRTESATENRPPCPLRAR